MHATDMSGLASPNNQRKQSNASGHSVDLAEPSTLKGSSKREYDDDDDVESNEEETGPKSEKRAGRRKIKIEYIDDKSRRHITFSKRKAGIMKKAYELSTLTGTQVLLLVVSETGLVYTFTTPKLQPLVTKPEGKNLIQACLNAPDAPSGQDPPNTARSAQNAPVYGNDGSAPVDANGDVYSDDRKPQTSGGQLSQTQPSYALGLSPYNQYSGIPNMTLGTSGIASQYMSSAGYPQYGQQHLNQYAPNNYMQQYWGPGGNKVPQYSNQSPEKK
ncbi:SRF-TF-domain-containing protein [Gigaspora margarita]|uniref:SRF-TF-domain-containing protein n=2 Tax=Gigaspora margarita TaxID=4874 RepID=A0A8H4ADE7_GIGMA|nr:SRF-TF-domain-containing protein [Gigaspora margarita]